MPYIQLAYAWSDHDPDEVVLVDASTARRLISEGRARRAPEAPVLEPVKEAKPPKHRSERPKAVEETTPGDTGQEESEGE